MVSNNVENYKYKTTFAMDITLSTGDWLQGPYVYQLYASYGFKESEIALLFLTGFASSSTFGTFTGPLADKYGRKKLALVFCVIYSACCIIKLSQNFYILILGRIMGEYARSTKKIKKKKRLTSMMGA